MWHPLWAIIKRELVWTLRQRGRLVSRCSTPRVIFARRCAPSAARESRCAADLT
jgi:hypothetical protein